MITITMPHWILYVVIALLGLSIIKSWMEIYLTYLKRKLRQLERQRDGHDQS